LYDEELCEAAKFIFAFISDWAKLAVILLSLNNSKVLPLVRYQSKQFKNRE
jgi:hypothetical protein